jgi:hypothetical protein
MKYRRESIENEMKLYQPHGINRNGEDAMA